MHKKSSLDNTYSYDELRKWYEKITNEFGNNVELVCELKIDGLAIALAYKNGSFVHGATRGNGVVGEDILHNAMVIPSIPKTIPMIIPEYRLVVDGEIICKYDDFKEFEDMYKIYPNDWTIKAASRIMALLCNYFNISYFIDKINMF